MKKSICILIIFITGLIYIGLSYAGEKEELTLRVQLRLAIVNDLQYKLAVEGEKLEQAKYDLQKYIDQHPGEFPEIAKTKKDKAKKPVVQKNSAEER